MSHEIYGIARLTWDILRMYVTLDLLVTMCLGKPGSRLLKLFRLRS